MEGETNTADPVAAEEPQVPAAQVPPAAPPAQQDVAPPVRLDSELGNFRQITANTPVCYCVYEEVAQGTFYLQWKGNTQEPICNHIMVFVPTKTVPKFKLVNDGGRSELATRVLPDKQKYWSALCLFLKQAKDYKATFQLLPGWHERVPFKSDIYLHSGAQNVTKVKYEPLTLEDVGAIGIAGRSNLLMSNRMSKEQFSQAIRKGGYCLMV
ncbi:hypothetical protein BgAZ_100530 [Babesia gibsoni]|uniref:Immune mapped protein 2 N-terminal domain-containing protein n=1 Tax=Babesia gibsoni TaxID=33632 RepID=A0AAD8UTD0_BABGI|nr:hypothetical protein BgAZ_100530 [Babesia gibsoni]